MSVFLGMYLHFHLSTEFLYLTALEVKPSQPTVVAPEQSNVQLESTAPAKTDNQKNNQKCNITYNNEVIYSTSNTVKQHYKVEVVI